MTKLSFSPASLMCLKIGRRLPFKGKKICRGRPFRNEGGTRYLRLKESQSESTVYAK